MLAPTYIRIFAAVFVARIVVIVKEDGFTSFCQSLGFLPIVFIGARSRIDGKRWLAV